MSLLTTLSLVTCLCLPQDKQASDGVAPLLAKSDHDALRNKLQDYFKARAAARDADESRKEGARKKEEAARDKFKKDWEAKVGKKNVLGNMADLRAIFAGCFEFERQTGTGDVRNIKAKGRPTFDLVLSKKYKPETPTPSVLLVRGHEGDKGWSPAVDWFAATWKAAPEAADFAFVLPSLDASIDFDPPVDLSKPEGEAADLARRDALLGSLGAASQMVHVDRDRIYLDCAKGSCVYAIRQATYSPHLFAGIVLRQPADPGDLRLDSLGGVPFLLLRTDATKNECDRLEAALNKLEPGTATVLDAKGAYPHAESAADISAWLRGRARDLMRPQIVFANTHDHLRRSFWMFMGTAEPLHEVAADARPRLEIVADRAANKITVTSRGVADFAVMLNDALVDLDKEIVAIINGKAQPPFKLDRSLNKLLDYVFNYRDPGMLFTAEKTFVVPIDKVEKAKDTKGEQSPK